MTPLTPDEALYAFVDGELELADEQHLFDALASHPELRTEMKDVLAIRNAVHRDVLFPSAAAETELLAATGLVAPVGAVAATTGGSTLLARLLHAGGGILAGVLLAYFLFDVNNTSQSLNDQRTLLQKQQAQIDAMASAARISDMELKQVRAGAQAPVRVETLYVRVAAKPTTPVDGPQANANGSDGGEKTQPVTTIADPVATVAPVPDRRLSVNDHSAMQTLLRERGFSEASPLAPGSSELEGSVRLRTLPSSLNGSRRIPESVNDAILPNTAMALMMPLNTDSRLGVEFGLDAFHQVFNTVRDGRPVEVDQTPVLYWFGGTYEFSPVSMEFLLEGLRPIGSLSLGYAFSQGPVGHAFLGLSYQPKGPVRFTAGMDYGGLGFRDRSNWFYSQKWGFTYGLSIDIGAIE